MMREVRADSVNASLVAGICLPGFRLLFYRIYRDGQGGVLMRLSFTLLSTHVRFDVSKTPLTPEGRVCILEPGGVRLYPGYGELTCSGETGRRRVLFGSAHTEVPASLSRTGC